MVSPLLWAKAEPGVVTETEAVLSRLFVQVGAYAKFTNANRARAFLSSLGPVKLTSVMVEGRDLFRVRIGPLATVSEADGFLAAVVGALLLTVGAATVAALDFGLRSGRLEAEAGGLRDELSTVRGQVFEARTDASNAAAEAGLALRGAELNADVLLKATKVDGVYTADPHCEPSAQRYTRLTFAEAIEKKLAVTDLTALTMCMENELPVIVFDFATPDNIRRVINGEPVGTLITTHAEDPGAS